jgi:hypothetical protein
MLVAPEFQGLDLPIHDPDTDVLTGDQYCHADELDTPTFIRTITIISHTRDASLAEILKITDQELDTVTELCGALVVGYQWGLQPSEHLPSRYGRYTFRGMPRGHRLVAEVDTLLCPPVDDDNNDLVESDKKLATGITEYYRLNGTRLYDIRWDQFMWSRRRADQIRWNGAVAIGDKPEPDLTAPQMRLVDIEQRLINYSGP